ncbi:MAG: hypothetical protein IGR93_13885 [Hydrococcus sp. C42_A2020_068]|nr:hypothetical protein [Hydrococcus sp. C42_A2020_068]
MKKINWNWQAWYNVKSCRSGKIKFAIANPSPAIEVEAKKREGKIMPKKLEKRFSFVLEISSQRTVSQDC